MTSVLIRLLDIIFSVIGLLISLPILGILLVIE